MKTEDQIKQEIRNELLQLTDNMATIILIESKILDFGVAVYTRAFKEASDIVSKTLNPEK